MRTITIKQRTIRLAVVTGLTVGMALSTGVAAASEVGYTECDQAGCAIASAAALPTRSLADVDPTQASLNGDLFRPHLTR